MSEEYTLKSRVGSNTLSNLNDKQLLYKSRITQALNFFSPNEEQMIDIVHAVYSGKKIVNPLSPREEFYRYYEQLSPNGRRDINGAIEIFRKEFHGIENWTKDSKQDD